MWKRAIRWLALCVVVSIVMFLAAHSRAFAPPDGRPGAGDAPGNDKEQPVPAAKDVKVAPSRIAAVTVYPNSALVTREVEVPEGAGTLELTVTPLPPTVVNSSLYSEGTTGIRVLTTRFRSRPVLEDTRADVRKLQDELKQLQLARDKLEAEIRAVQSNGQTTSKLEGFMGVTTVQATEKGVLNSEAAIALAKHIRESRLETARELVTLQQQVQVNQERAEFAQRRLSELTSGTIRTERDAVLVVEKNNAAAGKVRLHYLVDTVSWRPQYKFRAGKTAREAVQVEYLAAVTQHTGEDWSSVKLTLSTAEPTLNSAPPELQTLEVTVAPKAGAPVARLPDTMELEEAVKSLRSKAQKNFNEKKRSSGVGLVNTAAAHEQSWELFNPEAALKRGCLLAAREGATVTYHLGTRLSVPSRNTEQVLEVARLELAPDYYYKAVPILTTHVYRQADLINKSEHVLLPGEATMYIGTDFVGRMDLPLVAIGEEFTAGFGVDPQLQVEREMLDKQKSQQGGNQVLKYEYRILVSSYKSKPVKVQVWDRLPKTEQETVNVTVLKATPEVCADPVYMRQQKPHNLLRWDLTVEPNMRGEKAKEIHYEFKVELDRQMTIGGFQSK